MLRAVANRYAQALFDKAKGEGLLDQQLADLLKVQLVLRDHPSLARALQSPTISSEVKKSILRQVLESRVPATTLHFFYVLVDKNREAYPDMILECYKELLRQERDQIEVVVQSASELDASLVQQIDQQMGLYTGKKVELRFEIDPQLVGGLVLRLGDRIIDGSIRKQLIQIQERLSRAGSAAIGG